MSTKAIGQVQTITSMEVAEMTEREHSKLLRDIRKYEEYLGEAKIGFTDFWMASTYKTSQNKVQPCYLVTKKGCEFIAHKMTGQKGTVFTALYINRFHEMEEAINGKSGIESAFRENKAMIDLLTQQMNVLQKISERLDRMEQKRDAGSMPLLEDHQDITPTLPNRIIRGVIANELAERVDERVAELNDMVSELAVRVGRKKNTLFRNLYREIERQLDVTIDCYLHVAKREYREGISTLHAVAYFDDLYSTAKEILDFALNYARELNRKEGAG